ncbi:purple acid phosphatase family protein [Polaribacter aestuariivivens]|nr:metallophosphoesterase family protein [Polaribacter aestuariivivens]
MIRQLTLIGILTITFLSCTSVSKVKNNSTTITEVIGVKPELVREPYLQKVREESAIITWKTNGIVTNCYVSYSENGTEDKTIVKGYLTAHEGFMFNEVSILGLKPNTTYNYSIYSNGHVLATGKDYYFKTAPSNKNQAFSFYALGDIGAKEKSSFAKEPANRITELAIKPDFGLGLGDIVYPKGESKNYDNHLFKPFKEVFKNIPFYPVAGNHDWLSINHDENFKKEWNLPNKEYYYSFTYANTLFIGLDSRDGNFYDYEHQTIWLEKTLKENKDTYDWIVVYLHHNGKSCTYKNDYEHVKGLYDVFAKNSVDLVLNGHAHTYERLKPYDAFGNVDASETNQTNYKNLENRFISVTIGAGGKINKKWKPDANNSENCDDGTIVAHSEHVPSFGLITIEKKTLTFKGINSYTGETFDEFVINK